MFQKTIAAQYQGLAIVVQNSWGNGVATALLTDGVAAARKALGDETCLIVNGKTVGSTNTWILSRTSTLLLETSLEDQGNRYNVAVYGKSSWLKNLIKLCVNGERIAGDDF